MSQLYTDKLLMNLPVIFEAQTSFKGALAPVQVTDGVAQGTKAFTVKRSDTKVVVNKYDTTIDLNSGKSRFGEINEITYGDIDVDYDYQDAFNEAIDKFTVNAEEQTAIAERQALQAEALTIRANTRIGQHLSDSAKKTLSLADYTPENVSKLFDTASKYFKNKLVTGNRYAFVTPDLWNAMVGMIQFKSLTGAVVDVNNDTLMKYKGFIISEEPDQYFNEKDVAYFTAEQVVIPFVGIELSRTMEDSNIAGQLLQTAVKGGQFTQEENKEAIVKVQFGGTIEVSGLELSQANATVAVGATKAITATVQPEGASNKAVTWSTADQTIATVADGVITGVKAGKTTVTATTTDGGFTETVAVTVKEATAG